MTNPHPGGAAKQRGPKPPCRRQPASPEPPAGAAGTGGAQGRTPAGGKAQGAQHPSTKKEPGGKATSTAAKPPRPRARRPRARSPEGGEDGGPRRADPKRKSAPEHSKGDHRKPTAERGEAKAQGRQREPTEPATAHTGRAREPGGSRAARRRLRRSSYSGAGGPGPKGASPARHSRSGAAAPGEAKKRPQTPDPKGEGGKGSRAPHTFLAEERSDGSMGPGSSRASAHAGEGARLPAPAPRGTSRRARFSGGRSARGARRPPKRANKQAAAH